jgi:hypothetical protein
VSEREERELQTLNCCKCGWESFYPPFYPDGNVVENGQLFEWSQVDGKPVRREVPIYCMECYWREVEERSQ